MKTIIAGSRNITDYAIVEQAIADAEINITKVISGMAKGVDSLGELWAHRHNVGIHYCPANWNKHGKSAGYIRNAEMAQIAEALIAIWDGHSRGTKHMIDLAHKHNLVIKVFNLSDISVEK